MSMLQNTKDTLRDIGCPRLIIDMAELTQAPQPSSSNRTTLTTTTAALTST